VGFQPSEVEYHAGAYQGGGDPDIDPPLAEDGVVDLLGDTVPYRYRRIVVLEGTVRLQGDVVLRDIVDPGQEIRIREVVGIEDDDFIDSLFQVFQGVGDGFMFHAMLEIRREELDRELGERLVRFLPHMVRYHDHPVFVRRIVLQEDALHGFLYDLVFLIGGEDDGELLEPYAPVLPVPPPKKGRQRKK